VENFQQHSAKQLHNEDEKLPAIIDIIGRDTKPDFDVDIHAELGD
jgi:hypothetical protein